MNGFNVGHTHILGKLKKNSKVRPDANAPNRQSKQGAFMSSLKSPGSWSLFVVILVVSHLLLCTPLAHAEDSDLVFIGFTDAVKSEVRGGHLTPEANAYYLQQLKEVAGLDPTDKIEIVSYYSTGHLIRVKVPTGRGEAIAKLFEKANLPFAKFIDTPGRSTAAKKR
jgi:hypothetical protein